MSVVQHHEVVARGFGRHAAEQAAAERPRGFLPDGYFGLVERRARQHVAGYLDSPDQADAAVAIALQAFRDHLARLTGRDGHGGRAA